MQDEDVDEVVLNALLAEGIDYPTSLAAATREMRGPQPQKAVASWVQAALVLAAIALTCVIYMSLR